MLLKDHLMKAIFFMLSFFLLISIPEFASAQDKDKSMKKDKEKSKVYITENGQRYVIIGWEADVVYSPYSYTYIADIDPILAKTDPTLLRVEFDRPPLFSSECLMASDQVECTNQKIQEFASENIEYPDPASEEMQEGLEYVTFTLDENGGSMVSCHPEW